MSNALLEQANAARLNGDDQAAIDICRRALQDAPDNTDAMSLLGVSLAETGQLDEARPLIAAALNAAPDNWRYLLNQSILDECEGNLPAARENAGRAAARAPEKFEVWGRVGDLSGKMGNFRDAADALAKAVSINPEHPVLSLRLAGALCETDEYDRASEALKTFEKAAPGHPHAIKLRMHIARQTYNWEGLIEASKAWIAVAPQEEAAHVSLAFAYAQAGFFSLAADAYRPLAEKTPPNAQHLTAVGRYDLSARDLDSAESYFRRALEADPEHAEAYYGLGRMMTFLGRFEEAEKYSRRAIELDPKNIGAFGMLAEIIGGRFSDEELVQLEALGNDESLPRDHRALAWYAKGDGNHRRKEREQAFNAWSKGSALKWGIGEHEVDARYLPENNKEFVNRLMHMFASDPTPVEVDRSSHPAPIFIVGMPRSGTTLLESALAAHPEIACAGELPTMPFVQREFMAWARDAGWNGGVVPAEMRHAIRDKYFEQYKQYDVSGASFVTDKQPNNFLSVGLIRHVFPEARIINIRRNPVETGFSIFRRNFTRQWQFTNSLEEIGHYYGQYARISAHWTKTLGPNIAFIQYEELVRNFERELRRLVDFCGLDWNKACLEYYKAERTVITFSATQVRKPPSVEHLDSTTPYAEFLEPLRTALRQAGVDLETGALVSDKQQ